VFGWNTKKIIRKFGDALGLHMNEAKSILIQNGCQDALVKDIYGVPGVTYSHVDKGITYLDFRLKPKGYKNNDWEQLVDKIKHKLDGWKHKYISMGGRSVMLKSIV